LKMDPQHISAFSKVRTSEYLSVEENCRKLNKFIADYEAVKSSLTSLSEKCRHPVMVPFGNVAFMPGELVHTNEVLVLLGDNWFVEQSAKQTVDILSRRIAALQTQVGTLETRMQNIKTEISCTEELVRENRDSVEIVEPYNEEVEERWKTQHVANVRKYHRETKDSTASAVRCRTESDAVEQERIWLRLEELERQENAAENDGNEREDDNVAVGKATSAADPLSDASDDSIGDSGGRLPLVINFKHTVTNPRLRERHCEIVSPADIYDKLCASCGPVTSGNCAVELFEEKGDVPLETPKQQLLVDSPVVPCDIDMQRTSPVTDESSDAGQPTGRKMSKFKASRLKK